MGRTSTIVMIAFVATAFATAVSAQTTRPGTGKSPGQRSGTLTTSQPSKYTHPQRHFIMPIPPNSDVTERPETGDLVIQSRKGYGVKVHAKDLNGGVSIADLTRALESRELGKGKRWTRKLHERSVSVGGLPGYEAHYEGSNTRARVVLARGRKTDFAFLFVAPPRVFDSLASEFDWMMTGFRPGPEEIVRAGQPTLAVAVPTRPAPEAVSGGNRFHEAKFGFSLDYPKDWITSRPLPMTVEFSGRKGTDTFLTVVRIQNVSPRAASGPQDAMMAAVADYKSFLARQAVEVTYAGDLPFSYRKGGLRVEGRQFVVAYAHQGQRFRNWVVVLPRPSGTVAHVWSYSAPEAQFDAFKPFAQGILNSWTLEGGGR
jgi:hypothetical protein